MSGGYRSPTGLIGIQSTGAIILGVEDLDPGDLVVLVNRGPRLTVTTLQDLAQFIATLGGLINDGGVLTTTSSLFPISTAGLNPGQIWSNGGVLNVIPGYTPIPIPTLFAQATVSSLLAFGAIPFTTAPPPEGSTYLYVVGVEIWVA